MKKNIYLYLLLLVILYYFNCIGRTHGHLLNFIVTGLINFPNTYYLLKINPFKKMGLFLIFLPALPLVGALLFGLITSETMPGTPGVIMYILSTLAGLWLYTSKRKVKVILIYIIFLTAAFPNYYNLLNIYNDIAEKNDTVGRELPVIWITDKDGVKSQLSSNGKIKVIDLWSNTCATCIAAFPKFEKLTNDYKNDKEVEFLSINIYENGGDISRSKEYLKNYTFNNYYSDISIFKKLNFNAVPYYVIVGRDDKIKYFGDLNMRTVETYNNIYKLIENEK